MANTRSSKQNNDSISQRRPTRGSESSQTRRRALRAQLQQEQEQTPPPPSNDPSPPSTQQSQGQSQQQPPHPPQLHPQTPDSRQTKQEDKPEPEQTPHAIKGVREGNHVGKMETHGDIDYLVVGEIEEKITRNLTNLDKLKLSDEMIGFSPEKTWSRLQMRRTKALHVNVENAEDVKDRTRWIGYPTTPSADNEATLENIFNKVSAAAGGQPPRVWSSRFHDDVVPHDKCLRKPDLVLMNKASVDDPDANWSHIFAVGECKFGVSVRKKDVVVQLAQSVRLVFGAQPDRRFVLGVGVRNNDMALCVFNRGGLLCSDWFNVHQSPVRFIRIVAGLTRINREGLGFDPTMDLTTVDAETKRTVTVNGNVYDVEEVIHCEGVIRGRATLCLKVKREGKTHVVKNAWVDTSRAVREPQILEHLSGVKGVPGMIEYEAIKLADDSKDNTVADIKAHKALNPKANIEENCEEREQVRVVLSEFASPLREFKNKYELLNAFLNIVEALEGLHEKGALHRDISERNIMLGENGGLLIDYDYAILLSLVRSVATCHRTGTLPFMAIEILDTGKRIVHRYDHDLESIFYVMCYIFTTCSGPGNKRREDFKLAKSHIGKWFGKEDEEMASLAWNKRGHVRTTQDFKESIIDDFDKYFSLDAITECMENLREILFDIPKIPSQVLEIMKQQVTELPITYTAREDRDARKVFKLFKGHIQRARDAMKESLSYAPSLPKKKLVGRPSNLAIAETNLIWRDIDRRPRTKKDDVPQDEVVQLEENQVEDKEKVEDSGIASVSVPMGLKRKSKSMRDGAGDVPSSSKKQRTGPRTMDPPPPPDAGEPSSGPRRSNRLRGQPMLPIKDKEKSGTIKSGTRRSGTSGARTVRSSSQQRSKGRSRGSQQHK